MASHRPSFVADACVYYRTAVVFEAADISVVVYRYLVLCAAMEVNVSTSLPSNV